MTSPRPRSVVLFVLAPIVLLMTGAHVFMGVREHGVSAVAIAPPLLGLVLLAGILAAVFAWMNKIQRDPVARAPDAVRRRTRLIVGIGIAGASLSALAQVMTVRAERAKVGGKPADPTFHVEAGRAVSSPLAMTLAFPEPWTKLDLPSKPAANFVMAHPDGARFAGGGLVPDEPGNVDGTLERMLDDKRAQDREVDDVARGTEKLGELTARTLAFTTQGPDGPARLKLWLVERGAYWAIFHCAGAATTFTEIEPLCRGVLGSLGEGAAGP